MKHSSQIMITILTLTALTACGTRPADRVLSGAAIGGAAAAAGTAIVGGPVLAGAAVGAVAGGAVGGLTKSKNINLGKPLWRNDD